MKILLAMDNPQIPTGYASTCRLTAKELTKRGWDVYAISFNGGPQSKEITDWYGIKILPNYALSRNQVANYGDAETFAQIEREVKPDVYFWHNDAYRYSYIRTFPSEILDKSVFWLPFEAPFADMPGLETISKCKAIRFVTKNALSLHAEHLKDKNIGFIPHAVDMEFLSPNKSKDPKKFTVSRVDRHQPRKMWDLAIKAFAKFAKDKPDAFLLAKCNPHDEVMKDDQHPEGVDLEKMAEHLGVREKIKFDDYFFNPEFMAKVFYDPANVFLTTTSGEGFGLGLVEAMACGIPVICPDVPVLPEVLGEGAIYCKVAGQEWNNRMQVNYNLVDVDEVAGKLEWAYQEWKNNAGTKEDQLAKIGQAGRRIVEEKYSPKVVYDQWDEVLKNVAEDREKVSIVTVLYVMDEEQLTGEDGVGRLAETMLQHVTHPYEWVIVDNGSPLRDRTREWMKEAAAKNKRIQRVLVNSNRGFCGGCNAGIAHAKGKHVILLNPDSEAIPPAKHGLDKDFVALMTQKADSDPKIGIIGMDVNRRDDVLTGSRFPYFCNVLISRACLDAIKIDENKWFDDSFWPGYYEDCDLTLRVMGKGFKVVTDGSLPFWHKSGGTNRHAIKGGKDGPHVQNLRTALENLSDTGLKSRKRAELESGGMQALIDGNIAYLNSKWGVEARSKIKVCWHVHIGAGVGFSQIAEGLIPALHNLGFDVYVNDWSNGANVEDPLIAKLIEKTRIAKEKGELDDAINIVCWLMESFMAVDVDYKVGISLCESTRVRPGYLSACNSMDRILTFSEFCRGVQKDSGYTVPIDIIPPGVNPIFLNYFDRRCHDEVSRKFMFLDVGVSQERKDTLRLVHAFCEAFPKGGVSPECETTFPLTGDQIELVLKSNEFGNLKWVHEQGFDKKANIRTIYTGQHEGASRSNFSTQEMYDLYCEADCLVHPAHGEGIGYPLLEGAGTGLPLIFTNWSSPAEYFDSSNSFPCELSPYPGTTFTDAYLGHGCDGENGKWANIHIGHMKHLMRHVIRERISARKVGKAAAEMAKVKFTWDESARFLMPLLFEWDAERRKKVKKASFDPMTFVKPSLEPVKPGDRVMIDVASRDRHGYLSVLLMSLLNQTFKEWDIIIQCDDSDDSMPQDHLIMSLIAKAYNEGHGWSVIRSHKQGPHIAHERTLQMTLGDKRNHKLICRLDDDVFIQPDFLERLFNNFVADEACELAAVGGVYLDPRRKQEEQMAPPGYATDLHYAGKIDCNVMNPYVCKYPDGTLPREVEHLYSSFMYRTKIAGEIGGYCTQFSQLGHREESDFSYRFYLAGYKLLVEPRAVGFHFYAPAGGIRANQIIDKQKLAESDERIYKRRLDRWKRRAAQKMALEAKKKEPPKVAVVIYGRDIERFKGAIPYYAKMSPDVYVACPPALKDEISAMPGVKMVACDEDEGATLSKALLSEGEHDFVMTVRDAMRFTSDPLVLLDDKHDDYVFEVFPTYIPGRQVGDDFKPDETLGTVIAPEVKNECLIHRRGKQATSVEKTLFCDVMVLNDIKAHPSMGQSPYGKSAGGNDLIRLADVDKIAWRKICTYQFPEGKLNPPKFIDCKPGKFDVSIIVPTENGPTMMKKCLDSIYVNTSTSFEVIVVDNCTMDGSDEFLESESKKRPNLSHVRLGIPAGRAKALNVGIDRAKGDYILLFSDSAWVDGKEPDGRDWLETLMEDAKPDPLNILNPHGRLVGPQGGKGQVGDHVQSWCMMFPREAIKEVGSLDDVTFPDQGHDEDYCKRASARGYGTKVKKVRVRRIADQSTGDARDKFVRLKAKWEEPKQGQ